uniref:R3H domain-containing protein n=1 Tax=Macrostomum lignano TaxID=282301 RepID=A0A1I8FSA0_9PLAT
NQRERLILQLSSSSYECAICCHTVRAPRWPSGPATAATTSSTCSASRSGRSRSLAPGRRCRGSVQQALALPDLCQKGFETKCGFRYTCFCGKAKDPEFVPGECPHTCGQLCGKRRGELCEHPCNLPCHPGPCPPCQAFVTRRCYCGRVERRCQCCESVRCGQPCDKQLDCGQHTCAELCHQGDCPPCDKMFTVTCHCGKSEATQRPCADYHRRGGATFACQRVCGRQLGCGLHTCQLTCHPGACTACPRSPELAGTCPCGRATLMSLTGLADGGRKLCTDPLPACEATCGRVLHCDPQHSCLATCHDGDCPPCQLSTSVTCHCGRLTKEVPCVEATTKYRGPHADTLLCQRRLQKDAAICGELCCIQQDHPCPPDLLKAAAMRTPPVRGAVPPGPLPALPPHPAQPSVLPVRCSGHPASRALRCPAARLRLPVSAQQRPCGHPSLHECHLAGEPCPPCAYLISKRCQCGRSLRQNVPCHQTAVSCGIQCGRSLPCGHRCALLCHSGDCEAAAERQQQPACKQPCRQARQDCGHPCMLPCHHPEPCKQPPPCQEPVTLRCPCSRRIQEVPCHLTAQMGQCRLASDGGSGRRDGPAGELLWGLRVSRDALAYRELQTRGSLQCDAQCQLEKRNRQLAEALASKTDSNGSTAAAAGGGAVNLAPVYARTLLDLWKAYPSFAVMVESRLDETCSAVVSGRSQSRSTQFQAPNRDGRKFIYELAEVYGCEVQVTGAGSDASRTVTVTAKRGRARLPDRKLSAEAQRLFGIGGLQQQSASIVCCRGPSSRGAPGWRSRPAASQLTTLGRVATAYSRLPDQMDSMELGGSGGAAGSSATRIDYFDFTES